ncbi:MAG: hypothetical protein IPK81_19120 [Rhodospirillales bacterium]|nr:MAG: hypothetical protein IPK81_19120 [Rhodospirillales bacterium]
MRAALEPRARGRVLPLMPRIGLCRTAEWPSASAVARKTVEGAFAKLTAAGAPGFTVVSPPAWDRLVETHKTVMFPEMVPIFDGYIARGPDLISEGFKAQVADGRAIPPARLAAARAEMAARRADVARMIGAGEVWLAPAAPDEAPEGIERTGDPVFNRVWTLLGVPCLTLPAGKGKRGLPIGIQLIAAPGEDDALLDAAAWIEAALGAAG